ncbi:MAG: methyltransferase domain-containing protein [Clostridium sp.]|nr:methyltransferase domain-containing protein [Clostridium sp.]MDU7084926.1 methyltransferase domain-containing protein [Clostridium sp.]
MNIVTQYEKYNKIVGMFICPICQSKMNFSNYNSIVCGKRHCFDLSKHGYINFIPNQQQTKYTKDLFESRRYIFEEGFYKPLEDNIKKIIKQYLDTSKALKMLDVGCGEGFYSRGLSASINNLDIYAMDNAKDAIILGAKKEQKIKWFIGDLSNIPLKSNSMDLLLNIFTPSNYSEFTRILKSDGYLIKVVPGANYLKELRECAANQLANQKYSNESVIDYFANHMNCEEVLNLTYKMAVTKENIDNFLKMTPMMFNVDKEKLFVDDINKITLDFTIIVGKN